MSLCFYVNVYKDWKLAQRLIPQIRTLYPFERIICALDGVQIIGYEAFCQQHLAVGLAHPQRLKLSQFGGLWLQRMLSDYLRESDAPMLIKIDPDCLLLRPFKPLPVGNLLGSVQPLYSRIGFNGGCIALSRYAANRLLISGVLEQPKYKTPEFAYLRFQPPYLHQNEARSTDLLIASDLILVDACQAVGIQYEPWPDVFSVPFTESLNRVFQDVPIADMIKQFAVIHPVKDDTQVA